MKILSILMIVDKNRCSRQEVERVHQDFHKKQKRDKSNKHFSKQRKNQCVSNLIENRSDWNLLESIVVYPHSSPSTLRSEWFPGGKSPSGFSFLVFSLSFTNNGSALRCNTHDVFTWLSKMELSFQAVTYNIEAERVASLRAFRLNSICYRVGTMEICKGRKKHEKWEKEKTL